MLALLRPRCQLPSSRLPSTRTLRTLPRVIPGYIKRWDPTLHRSSRPQLVSTEQNQASQSKSERTSQQTQHEGLLRTPTRVSNAAKRLEHIIRCGSPSGSQYISLREQLWQAYVGTKAAYPEVIRHLTDRAWDILWFTQAEEVPGDHPPNARREKLCQDMAAAGKILTTAQRKRLTTGQRVLYLENMFLRGNAEQALKAWEEEDHHTALDGVPQAKEPEHLEIGAKLHALAGNLDRARQIMTRLCRLDPGSDTSAMMTVFRAHTSSDLREHHDVAIELYLQMKQHKGAAVSAEDYDAWLVGFLEARALQYARQVFRDMVKDNCLATDDSAEHIEEVLRRLHMLYRLGTDISKMTSIALDAISVLPSAYHGHLFGDLMKATVEYKAPQAATQILDMMFQRGCKAETFHFNMLLRVLLRTKETPNILKAENIGWGMIDETRKAQKRQQKHESIPEIISRKANDSSDRNLQPSDRLPVADVTTFALIMAHHARSSQWEHVDYLSRQLKGTSIAPNATIMNVLMDNKCRQGAYAETWRIYKQLTEPDPNSNTIGLFPNGTSMRILWKTLRLALGDHATRSDPFLPTPRALLKETVSWWTLVRSRYDASRFRQGLAAADSGAITGLILHCFSYTQDPAGSLVALHILRHHLDIFPGEKAAQILQRQLSWVDMSNESQAQRSDYFHSRSNKRNTERIRRVYEILGKRRLKELEGREGQMSKQDMGDLGLNLLSEFVRVVLKRRYPPEVVEMMIEAAKGVVGVPGLETGDMDAFEVA